jgi:hypothetical protein
MRGPTLTARGLLAAVCACCACASLQQPATVEANAPLDAGTGYVAGIFTSSEESDRAAYVLADAQGREYLIPVLRVPRRGFGEERQVVVIAVPPGEYRIAGWMEVVPSKKVEIHGNGGLVRPFLVRPAQVVLLGHFRPRIGGRDYRFGVPREKVLTTWWVGPLPFREDLARKALAEAYPSFAAAPVECLYCSTAGAGATDEPPPGQGNPGRPERATFRAL